MIRAVTASLSITWSLTVRAAEPLQIPPAEEVDENRTAFAVEQQVRESPIRFDRDCPPPETVDVFQRSTWNSVEFGVSFPLGDALGETRLYTRYNCPAPSVKSSR
ncbi:hypothetical protein [Oligoflexus tunisiensis]|uniref:hypothetical protein n=1 Tax=Oligoflexus tunisiensis TaxID=708132 RepID=UPI00114D10AD|nr:hypothetical protein [Oligoflexus tunisiensis]